MSRIIPTLLFDFAATKQLDRRLTFSRTTQAGFINRFGLYEIAAINEPCFTHDSLLLDSLGISLMPQATNVALYSRDLTNAAWIKSNTSTAKTQIGMDGVANSCSLLTATSSNGTCLQPITLSSSSRVTSVYIKRAVGSGAISITQDGGSTWTDVTSLINSTYFVRVNTAVQTLTNPGVGFKLATSGDAIIVDLVQNETGPDITSAIITDAASVTRSADSLAINDLSSFYTQSEGTFLLRAKVASTASDVTVFALDDGATTQVNQIDVRFTSSGTTCRPRVRSAGVSTADLSMAAIASNQEFSLAFSYKKDDVAAALNSGAVVTDTSGDLPAAAMSRLRFGYRGAASASSAIIRLQSFSYFPKRLTNAQLQELSR